MVLESVLKTGLIQEPQPVFTESGEIVTRDDLDLPPLRRSTDVGKFKEARPLGRGWLRWSTLFTQAA